MTPPTFDPRESERSRDRERMLKHIFMGELLKEAWFRRNALVEVLRSEVDSAGYELVLENGGTIRHVQLRASRVGARTRGQKVSRKLAEKAGGCVFWIQYDTGLDGGLSGFRYLFHGGEPNARLTLDYFRVGKRTRPNRQGVNVERQEICVVPRSEFRVLRDIGEVYSTLFGSSPRAEQP